MKRRNDPFVLVDPNSPKKRKQKRLISHGQLLSFGSAPTGSDSQNSRDTHDENLPYPNLGSPWVPLSRFKTWDPLKALSNSGSTRFPRPTLLGSSSESPWTPDSPANQSTSYYTFPDKEGVGMSSFVPLESPPVVLELSGTADELGYTLETSDLRVDTLTRRYMHGMRRDQYPRVREAISQPVRRRCYAHTCYRTRFRSNKIDRCWAQLFGSYRSRRAPTC